MSDPKNAPTLTLALLRETSFRLSLAFREFLLEAASVCLDDQGHRSGVSFRVDGEFNQTYNLLWQAISNEEIRTHGDPEVATEYGAYALALLLTSVLTEYTVIERSIKGTGFDFWLGTKEDFGFQHKARLEVSGIRSGNIARVRTRIREKLVQVGLSGRDLPAFIVVVEFGEPISMVVKR
jgi:hypothetical protein